MLEITSFVPMAVFFLQWGCGGVVVSKRRAGSC